MSLLDRGVRGVVARLLADRLTQIELRPVLVDGRYIVPAEWMADALAPVVEELAAERDRLADLLEVRTLERDQARTELAEELRYRTLGGTPPAPDRTWANLALPPPDTATAVDAPPLHRPTIGEAR